MTLMLTQGFQVSELGWWWVEPEGLEARFKKKATLPIHGPGKQMLSNDPSK